MLCSGCLENENLRPKIRKRRPLENGHLENEDLENEDPLEKEDPPRQRTKIP